MVVERVVVEILTQLGALDKGEERCVSDPGTPWMTFCHRASFLTVSALYVRGWRGRVSLIGCVLFRWHVGLSNRALHSSSILEVEIILSTSPTNPSHTALYSWPLARSAPNPKSHHRHFRLIS